MAAVCRGVVQASFRDARVLKQALPLGVVGPGIERPAGWRGEDVDGLPPEVSGQLALALLLVVVLFQ